MRLVLLDVLEKAMFSYKFVRFLPSKGDILQEPSKLLKKYPFIGN